MLYVLSFFLGLILTLSFYPLLTREKSAPENPTEGHLTHLSTFVPTSPRADRRARVAIVIDDLGEENHISHDLLACDVSLTLSILPFGPYSRRLADEAHRKGMEIILHLPMEPQGYPATHPGEGALLSRMSGETLLHQLSKDLEALPHIKGVSNHMGSRFMEDPHQVKTVFAELKKRKLFFFDSGTTPRTVGLQVAKALHLKAAKRTLFLDHGCSENHVRENLERLSRLALSNGEAIAIGHPLPSTVAALKQMVPRMKEKGIEIVPLSELVE